MNFVNSIIRQSSHGFTGRINILHCDTREYLGVALLKHKYIVGASFKETSGLCALYRIVMADLYSDIVQTVVEPELIKSSDSTFALSLNEFAKKAHTYWRDCIRAKKLRPEMGLQLAVNGDILLSGVEINEMEFDVMDNIVQFGRVENIYKILSYMDYEITISLVRLRTMGALIIL